jgi:trigger factor
MQVSVEVKEGLERVLTITVDAEVFEKEFDKRVRQLCKSQRVDGFRAGKVPASVIVKRFGPSIEHEVGGELMQQNYYEAIIAEKLNPAGGPTVAPQPRKKGEAFVYTATVEVYPEVAVAALEELNIEKESASVSDEDLNNMIETLRKQHVTYNEVERESANDDQVTIDFVGSVDGEEFEGGKAEAFQIVLGSERMIPGFEAGILGHAPGSEFTIDVKFPDDYQAGHLKGKEAQFAIKLTKVEEETLPELTEEFIKNFGVESGNVDDLRNDVKKNMERELAQVLKNSVKQVALDALVNGNDVLLPKALVEQEVEVLRKQAMERYAKELGDAPELPANLFTEQAEKRVKVGLLLGEVIKSNDLKVNEDKVTEMIESSASAYENPAEVVEYFKDNKEMMQNMENAALEEQAVDFILEKAMVSEIMKSFDEVMNKTA